MEKAPSALDNVLKYMPAVRFIGRELTKRFGSRIGFEQVIRAEDSELGQQEEVEQFLGNLEIGEFDRAAIDHQKLVVARIMAKRLLIHMELQELDVRERTRNFGSTFDEISHRFSLSDLGLSLDETEALRIKLKELEQ